VIEEVTIKRNKTVIEEVTIKRNKTVIEKSLSKEKIKENRGKGSPTKKKVNYIGD
jgi:hypothetical protein